LVDSRVQEYAKLLIERCLDVQPRWQVEVVSTIAARPLVEEVVRAIARRGAYPLVRLSTLYERRPFQHLWAEEAPEELLEELPSIEQFIDDEADAWLGIGAPENAVDGSDTPPERRAALGRLGAPFVQKRLALETPWVVCRYPTPALAQNAGMTLRSFEDFLYGACLLDWDEEGRKMRRIADRFDKASEVRIIGKGTDIKIGLEDRHGEVDDGRQNMPGGEVFYSPVEDATEGVVHFSEFPAVQEPDEVWGVRMVYREGRVVEASAERGEEALFAKLDRDEGARVLGELGIGCNPGIQQHTKETLFDEKIYGTIHLAIGQSLPTIGGKNVSSVHWDMVKDLRQGGRIECDGEVVQENGEWTF
jgi:aminopeptidase